MVARDTSKSFDIVIAGGGMVGSCLALALAPLALRVAIVEPVPRDAATQPSFDDRSTAVSRSSRRMFEALGFWEQIRDAATPIARIHVSDRGRFGFSHIDAAEQGVEALGYVVINRVLGDVLRVSLDALAGLETFCPKHIVAAAPGPDKVRVELDDGRRLDCKLLAVADGANSAVRAMLGIPAKRRAYGQRAIVGNVLPEQPLGDLAYERFTEQGPLALLPIAEHRAAFVWNVPEADADRVLGLDETAFLAELQQAFGYRQGEFSHVGRRASYPLVLSKAVRVTAQRSALVGNAANGLHPAAAQGFNLGLRDVAALCDCVADADGDIGDPQVLRRYAEWRRSDRNKLIRLTDSLVRLFGSTARPVRLLRDVGMLGFDLVPGLRKQFARHAMGLSGRLPRLSRGVPLP